MNETIEGGVPNSHSTRDRENSSPLADIIEGGIRPTRQSYFGEECAGLRDNCVKQSVKPRNISEGEQKRRESEVEEPLAAMKRERC